MSLADGVVGCDRDGRRAIPGADQGAGAARVFAREGNGPGGSGRDAARPPGAGAAAGPIPERRQPGDQLDQEWRGHAPGQLLAA